MTLFVVVSASPKQAKATIDAVFRATDPEYLMILGAPDVVPQQDLTNPLCESALALVHQRDLRSDVALLAQPLDAAPAGRLGQAHPLGQLSGGERGVALHDVEDLDVDGVEGGRHGYVPEAMLAHSGCVPVGCQGWPVLQAAIRPSPIGRIGHSPPKQAPHYQSASGWQWFEERKEKPAP